MISSWFCSKLVMLCNYMPGSHFWDLFRNTTTRSFSREKSVSEKKGHDQPQFPLLIAVLKWCLNQPCIFLILHSAYVLGVLLKSANVTVREHFIYLGHPPKKEPLLNTYFKVVLSGAQRATLVPEEPWCPCVGEPWAIPWLRDRNYL